MFRLLSSTHISSIVITWFISQVSLLTFYETQGFKSPDQVKSSLVKCTPSFSSPQYREGVDDVVIFENHRTAVKKREVYVECDLLLFGSWIIVKGAHSDRTCDDSEDRKFALKELNLRNDTVCNPWMSCRFVTELYNGDEKRDSRWTREFTPPLTPTQPFESYLNVSLEGTRGDRSVTRVLMNDTGIFVQQQLVALWGENKGLISTDPGLKYLNSRDGNPCYSICTKRSPKYMPDWPALCHSGLDRHLQYCDPRDDYDIRKYALDGILSVEGIPCITPCEWGSGSGRTGDGDGGYRCWLRSFDEFPEMSYSVNCSPSPGLTFLGDNCTGPCSFTNRDRSSCAVAGEAREVLCSV